jgi:hypothetical protein
VKIKINKEVKRSARQEWHRRFLWLPKRMNLDGQGHHFVWLETVEARYSKRMKKWCYRDPSNDYSNVVSFDVPNHETRQGLVFDKPESAVG